MPFTYQGVTDVPHHDAWQPELLVQRQSPFAPPPEYDRLGAEEPVCKVQLPTGGTAWLVTRYEDVRTVLSNPVFSADALAFSETGPHRRRPRMLWKHLRAVLAPVVVTIVVPAVIVATMGARPVRLDPPLALLLLVLGVLLVVAGVAMEAWAIWLFDRVGKGTLSPLDPTGTLVVRGPYRHVRNPMFSAVFAILLGEAIAARSPVLLAWFAVFFLLTAIGVPRIEEPGLARRFGADYAHYRDNVPRWLPRLRPWQPPPPQQL